jgi:hypothetical protein
VEGIWKLEDSTYGDYNVLCHVDLALLVKGLNQVHVNDRKFSGRFSPTVGQRRQVYSYLGLIEQITQLEPHSASIHYAFDIRGPKTYVFGVPKKIDKEHERMAREIYIYQEIKDNPSKAKQYFEEFEDRMFDMEEVKQAVEKL